MLERSFQVEPGSTWRLEHTLLRQHLTSTKVRVSERLAAQVRFREGVEDQHVAMLRYVLAVRVGVGWNESSQSFSGPVSILPTGPGDVTAVAGLSDRAVDAEGFPKGGDLAACHGMPSTLFTFGCGPYGELGHARSENHPCPEPTAVHFPSSAPRNGEPLVEAIAVGTDHSLAVVGGKVYRWGLHGAHAVPRSWRGRCEERTSSSVVPAPLLLADLRGRSPSPRGRQSPLRRSQSPRGRGCAAIACGGSNSFLLSTDGEVLMFGGLWPPGGETDQLRHLWGTARGGPSSKVAQVAAGWRHCLFLTEAGRVFALGDDEFGQCAGSGSGAAAIPLPSAQMAVGVAAGACHSFAWDTEGSAFSWGHGGNGRLGLGSSHHRSSPHKVDVAKVCGVSCGANFSFFVTDLGRLWACGGNHYGQLGNNESTSSATTTPVPVHLDEEVVGIACGANHVICLTRFSEPKDGRLRREQRNTVWAWGSASSGQCGRTERTAELKESQLRPERLLDFSPPSPHFAVAVAAGRSHSAVLASRGDGSKVLENRLSPRSEPRLPVSPPPGEDIIEEFLIGLVEPSGAKSISLVELGEAALEADHPEPLDRRARHGSARRSERRLRSPQRRRLGGTPLRQRRPNTARQPLTPRLPGPPAPPGPQSCKPRTEPLTLSEPVTVRTQPPRTVRAVSPVPRAAATAATVTGSATGRLLAEALAVQATPVDDKWSGIHESLKGLSSFIAKIGSPERSLRSSLPQA
ncbi:RCC1 and BTB domain-containing protein 2 (Chromosome condensation 1-like) (Regulator of chromosome condensation and BTB domain-containing protein 2) [Durusdinium trenchii]|uniref:RCC1 and BTB domain-containing protein 2 (Chromosome condensation 1-like) (Regulator of chromosome condensation and BTB domain-containing protein 2) n=1 Tax=Durusdinium trenchii TaxID=1381693 RepID=A0ABP0HFL0_9DINO